MSYNGGLSSWHSDSLDPEKLKISGLWFLREAVCWPLHFYPPSFQPSFHPAARGILLNTKSDPGSPLLKTHNGSHLPPQVRPHSSVYASIHHLPPLSPPFSQCTADIASASPSTTLILLPQGLCICCSFCSESFSISNYLKPTKDCWCHCLCKTALRILPISGQMLLCFCSLWGL